MTREAVISEISSSKMWQVNESDENEIDMGIHIWLEFDQRSRITAAIKLRCGIELACFIVVW